MCGLVANIIVVLFHTCYFLQCVWVGSNIIANVIFLSVCGLVANIIVVLFRTCYFLQCVWVGSVYYFINVGS